MKTELYVHHTPGRPPATIIVMDGAEVAATVLDLLRHHGVQVETPRDMARKILSDGKLMEAIRPEAPTDA